MELVAENAIDKWRQVIGPTSTDNARAQAPNSIRALFGTDNTKNAVHGSDSVGSMKRETDFWFGGDAQTRPMKTTAVLNNCSLCIIKPHIVMNG
jgi:nucleoside-diphosphate kinase